jgi:hypothetical protein
MAIPPQSLAMPARIGIDVWTLTPAPDHDPPWAEHYAGQLEDEPLEFDHYVPVEAGLDLTFLLGRQDGRGATVEVEGTLRFERSVPMRFLFRGPRQSTGPLSQSDSQEVVLIPAGSGVLIARQNVERVAGTHPWLTVRLVDVGGRPVGVEESIGGSAWSAA